MSKFYEQFARLNLELNQFRSSLHKLRLNKFVMPVFNIQLAQIYSSPKFTGHFSPTKNQLSLSIVAPTSYFPANLRS